MLFTELGTLNEVVVQVWSLYEKYFSKLPSGYESQSGLQSAHNMLKFYADIRSLVTMIFKERG